MKNLSVKKAVVAVALAATMAGAAYAQETREPVRVENRDDGMDYGWLGLLGLAGLYGLKRRDREYDSARDRVAVNR